MLERKCKLLKRFDELKSKNISVEFDTLEREGFDRGFIRSLVAQGLLGNSIGPHLHMTEKGESFLQNCLVWESKKDKEKLILDTQIYDKIIDENLDLNLLKKSLKNIDYHITHIQSDELSRCPKGDKREKLLLIKSVLRPIVIETESFVLSGEGKEFSKLGFARLGDGKILEKLRKGNVKYTNDALIGETAIKNNLTLVTIDFKLAKKVKSEKGSVISFDEFVKKISSS